MTDPQSFNRYGYVQNDPVNFVDPSGLCGFQILARCCVRQQGNTTHSLFAQHRVGWPDSRQFGGARVRRERMSEGSESGSAGLFPS